MAGLQVRSSAKLAEIEVANSQTSDPRDREIGEMNQENIRRLLSSLTNYLLTERLGYELQHHNATQTLTSMKE